MPCAPFGIFRKDKAGRAIMLALEVIKDYNRGIVRNMLWLFTALFPSVGSCGGSSFFML
jgi:hypothetical protein